MKIAPRISLAMLAVSCALAKAQVPAPTEPAPAPEQPAVAAGYAALTDIAALLKKYGLTFDAATAQQAAIEAMVQTADPRARILTPKALASYQEQQAGLAFEAGLRIRLVNGAVKITEVVEGSPAAVAGIQNGDLLTEVDGGKIDGLQDWEIARLLRGTPDDKLTLVFLRNETTQQVEVATARLPQPAVAATEDLPGKLGLVRINGIYTNSSREIIPALRAWDSQDYHGLILDLRGAGGADLDAAADAAALFSEDNAQLFSLRDARDQDLQVFRARPGARMDIPIMVLIDADTTGAAEVLAATLADSVRGAMLLGIPTQGDPCVREVIPLPDGNHLLLATRRLVTADGTMYAGREGVQPDVVVAGPDSDLYDYPPDAENGSRMNGEEKEKRQLRDRTRGDPALRRAADILLALKALNIRGITVPPPTAP